MKAINKKELAISTVKSIFGAIPYCGPLLDELFFDYNARIKQNRINRFVELIIEHVERDPQLRIENIKTEEFNDVFEAVIKRVVITRSKAKLIHFKNILFRELNEPSKEPEFVEVYLDLISTLSEIEFRILHRHRIFDESYANERLRIKEIKKEKNALLEKLKIEKSSSKKLKAYHEKNDTLTRQLEVIQEKHDSLKIYRTAETYGISKNRMTYYLQSLFSKGLLFDSGVGGVGTRPFELMSITEFGQEFIDYIRVQP